MNQYWLLNPEKIVFLESDQEYSKQTAEESIAESEVILTQHEKYNTKNTTHMYK